MKLLVCGGREYRDWGRFMECLDSINADTTVRVVIHGCAKGADALADNWAEIRHKHVMRFPANWVRDGKAAGPIRNQHMLETSKPDMVVAFPGGRGTADMVKRAKDAGVKVVEVS